MASATDITGDSRLRVLGATIADQGCPELVDVLTFLNNSMYTAELIRPQGP